MMGFYDNNPPEDLLKNRVFTKKRRLLNYATNSNGHLSASTPFMAQFDGKQKKILLLNKNLTFYLKLINRTSWAIRKWLGKSS